MNSANSQKTATVDVRESSSTRNIPLWSAAVIFCDSRYDSTRAQVYAMETQVMKGNIYGGKRFVEPQQFHNCMNQKYDRGE